MQILTKAGKSIIKLLQREARAIDDVIDLATTVGGQNHEAAEAAKDVVLALHKLRKALQKEEAAQPAATA